MEKNANSFDQLADTIQTIATGIPTPVSKNFWKMFGQLCTASIGVPVAHLEGMANVVKAKYDSRAEIIRKTGQEIQDEIIVPEVYSKLAAEKYASKILRLQANTDKIVQIAAEDLASIPIPESESEPCEISEEWLNEFEEFAKLKTSEDMQQLFGKILANEVRNPGHFSIKTLSTVSQLDHDAAECFNVICKLVFAIQDQGINKMAFVPDLGSIIEAHGLGHYKRTILEEYGLLNVSMTSLPITMLLDDPNFLLYGGNKLLISKGQQYNYAPIDRFGAYTLTNSGVQLFSALAPQFDQEYFESLEATFNSWGYEIGVI